jgi:hypothetical protein
VPLPAVVVGRFRPWRSLAEPVPRTIAQRPLFSHHLTAGTQMSKPSQDPTDVVTAGLLDTPVNWPLRTHHEASSTRDRQTPRVWSACPQPSTDTSPITCCW